MKSFKDHLDEVAANSAGSGGVDMSPNGYSKADKRKKDGIEAMYRRSLGLRPIKKMIERRKKNNV
jgi:hypothetical protein